MELERRIKSMNRVSGMWNGFWRLQSIPTKHKALFFKGIVISIVFSAITSFALSKQHYMRLSTCIVKKIKYILNGRTCTKNDDGVVVSSISHKHVLASIGVSLIHIEVAVLRLRWMASVLKNRDNHSVFLAAFFGVLVNVPNGCPLSHPHMQQFMNDLKLCHVFDEIAEDLPNVILNPVLVVSDDVFREKFVGLDFLLIKGKFSRNEIAPPEAFKNIPRLNVPCNDVGRFVCLDRKANNVICGLAFSTFKHLQIHRMNADLGGDHCCLTVASLCICNQCPNCLVVFGVTCGCETTSTKCIYVWCVQYSTRVSKLRN
jgi:hypothetical protein